MKHSLQLRFTLALGILFGICLITSLIQLLQFHSYEAQTTKILTGDQRNLVDSQLLEAKIKSLVSMLEASVSSADGNDAFKDKVNAVIQEIKSLEIKNVKIEITDDIKKTPEDLFIAYRNIKTTAFQIYRNSWANKWMNLARMMGLILNDIDNVPYYVGDKGFATVNTKITQITSMVTVSALPQAAKLSIFSQISTLKDKIVKYSENYEKSFKLRHARNAFIEKLSDQVHDYNQSQTKNLSKFTDGNNHSFLFSMLLVLSSSFICLIWTWLNLRGFSRHLAEMIGSLSKQLSNWFMPSGATNIQEITKPRYLDHELSELYEVSNATVKKVNAYRKEDVIVKRLLNVPFVLVSKPLRKAVYWNSSLSILGKIRALEEMGAATYSNLLRFTDIQGKVVDPVEKCFLENKEVVHLLLFKSGQENIASQVTVTPVTSGNDSDVEYAFVQIKDLREENKRLEAELDRQLESVRVASNELSKGRIPATAVQNSRKVIMDTIESLRAFALVHSNKQENITQKMESVWEKVTRENNLKHTIQSKFESIGNELTHFHENFSNLQILSNQLKEASRSITHSNISALKLSDTVLHKGNRFSEDVKRSKTLLAASLAELGRAEELTKKVRSHEKTIHQLMQKASLLTINNTILENKIQMNPEDIIMITENLNQILIQFQRTYRLIESSVHDIEKGFQSISTKIREQMGQSMALIASDQSVMGAVEDQTQQLAKLNTTVDQIFNYIDTFDELTVSINTQGEDISDKAQKMLELTKASLQLHDQIEQSIKEVSTIQAEGSKLEGESQNISSVLNASSVG